MSADRTDAAGAGADSIGRARRTPTTVTELAGLHLDHLRTIGRAEATVDSRRRELSHLARWLSDRGVDRAVDVDRELMAAWALRLARRRKADGTVLRRSTRHVRLVRVREFFRWLHRTGLILTDPSVVIEPPRYHKRLPKAVLTAREAERVLAQPDVSTPLGLRDRSLLEALYSTGMRRQEAAGLRLCDVDAERALVTVRRGKGGKDRTVPIGRRALLWMGRYVSQARPGLLALAGSGGRDPGEVWLSTRGRPMPPRSLSPIASGHVDAAEIGKRGSCHLFRHTAATLMLENGADVRFIQELLGHASLETTQAYTHVAISGLRKVHAATHPAEEAWPEESWAEAGADLGRTDDRDPFSL